MSSCPMSILTFAVVGEGLVPSRGRPQGPPLQGEIRASRRGDPDKVRENRVPVLAPILGAPLSCRRPLC